jgi:hypothetical protein
VFIAAAIPIGLVLGALAGGRLDGLVGLRFRFAWLAVAGLAVQVLLFNGPLGAALEEAPARAAYVGSTAIVLGVVLVNLRLPGLPVVALGSISNLTAIVANGGVMPATPGAVESAGLGDLEGFSNSATLGDPVLAPLTDVFAIPAGLPLANVFSVGDVAIGVGVVWAIVMAMRTPGSATLRPSAGDPR